MDEREIKEKIRTYGEKLKNHLAFKKIILFGSQAKRNSSPYSDIDIAIVVERDDSDFFVTRPLLWRLAAEVDSRIEPILLEETNDPSGFLDDITKHGEVIISN